VKTLAPIVSLALAVLAIAPPAHAGEFELDGEGMAVASTWRGDYGAGGQLRLGYRFARIVAIDVLGWEQYMAVDHRADTGLTLGVSGFLPLSVARPFARLFFIHQHEEALVSVEDHAFGTVFGVGAGIRHRAGGGGSLGVEIPFERTKRTEFLVVAGGTVTWFPDATLGPDAYFSLFAGLGLAYSIPGLP
jgi:hypothetical protein